MRVQYYWAAATLLPVRYRKVFEFLNEFSEDAQDHAQQIREGTHSLNAGDGAGELPGSIRKIDRFFRIADWLAANYQKKSLLVLGTTHVLALLMGIMYINNASTCVVASRVAPSFRSNAGG